MRKSSVLIAALAIVLPFTAAPQSAQAVPIEYNFVVTSSTGFPPSQPFYSTLTVDSAALSTGLNFVSDCPTVPGGPCTQSGNWQDFVSLTMPIDVATTDIGFLAIDITFNVDDGTITGTIDSQGVFAWLQIAGDGFSWATTSSYLSDAILECNELTNPCNVAGYYYTTNPLANATVPEPASMIAVATALALFGGAAMYRRQDNI